VSGCAPRAREDSVRPRRLCGVVVRPSTSPLACRDVPCYILAMRHISVADVVALPVAERLRLVEAIWHSIAEVPEQLELSPAQAAELDLRLADFEKDPTLGSPWQEVRVRLERTR